MFAIAYFTGEDERTFHLISGYAVATLVALRLVWGLIGSPYARFAEFVPTARVLVAYLRDVRHRKEARFLGHNPAGGTMIVTLLAIISLLSVSGILLTTDAFWGSNAIGLVHRWLADVTLAFVVLHVCGVVWTSFRLRENLIKSMLTGYKRDEGGVPSVPGDV